MAWIQNSISKFKIILQMIKFEHTLFALPFAYLGLWLGECGFPRFRVFFFVTLAMVGLRTTAMCLNRIVDRAIDRQNPRTKNWALPSGKITVPAVWAVAIPAAALYFISAAALNSLCLKLSLIPLALVSLYPYCKRFTWFCHFVLGITLGIAPAGGWIASQGSVSPECWLLFFAVIFWVAGFDMIYALQDMNFDRAQGLKSIPALFDSKVTFWLTRLAHLLTVIFLALVGAVSHLGIIYWAGFALVIFFLLKEHWLILKFGLNKIQEAFFQMNILVSGVLFLATVLDLSFKFKR